MDAADTVKNLLGTLARMACKTTLGPGNAPGQHSEALACLSGTVTQQVHDDGRVVSATLTSRLSNETITVGAPFAVATPGGTTIDARMAVHHGSRLAEVAGTAHGIPIIGCTDRVLGSDVADGLSATLRTQVLGMPGAVRVSSTLLGEVVKDKILTYAEEHPDIASVLGDRTFTFVDGMSIDLPALADGPAPKFGACPVAKKAAGVVVEKLER